MRKRKETTAVDRRDDSSFGKRMGKASKTQIFRQCIHSLEFLHKFEGEVNFVYNDGYYLDERIDSFERVYSMFGQSSENSAEMNIGRLCDLEVLKVIEKEEPDNIRLSFSTERDQILLEKQTDEYPEALFIDLKYFASIKNKNVKEWFYYVFSVCSDQFKIQTYWDSGRIEYMMEYQDEQIDEMTTAEKEQYALQKEEYSVGKAKQMQDKIVNHIPVQLKGFHGEIIQLIELCFLYLVDKELNIWNYHSDDESGAIFEGELLFLAWEEDKVYEFVYQELEDLANNSGVAPYTTIKSLGKPWDDFSSIFVLYEMLHLINDVSVNLFKGYGFETLRSSGITGYIQEPKWRKLYGILQSHFGKSNSLQSVSDKYDEEIGQASLLG